MNKPYDNLNNELSRSLNVDPLGIASTGEFVGPLYFEKLFLTEALVFKSGLSFVLR